MWRFVVAFLFLASAAFAADMPAGIGVGKTAIGDVLVDAKGMTLYTFTEDSAGKSACMGVCAKSWPPLAAPQGAPPAGDFSGIAREDGGWQWAYKGMPLYLWVRDKAPGDTTGHGFRDIWHVARP